MRKYKIIDLIDDKRINGFLFHFSLLCFVVFNEGEEGMSWYIILKGSVNVVVHGKVRRTKSASLTAPTFNTFKALLIKLNNSQMY